MRQALKRQLRRIRDNNCVMVNGTMRDKHTFARYRVTKTMLDEMVRDGYIILDRGFVRVTKKACDELNVDRRYRGEGDFHHLTVTIHDDDLDRFKEMMKEFKR